VAASTVKASVLFYVVTGSSTSGLVVVANLAGGVFNVAG
jgi:hypothetical protein